MSDVYSWRLLGFRLPRLGADKVSLRNDGFLPVDRSRDQDPAAESFVQDREEGSVVLSVYSGEVIAITIMTEKSQNDLEARIAQDSRCSSRSDRGGFDCRLGSPPESAHVVACGSLVAIYAEGHARSDELVTSMCAFHRSRGRDVARELPPEQQIGTSERSRKEPRSDGAVLPPQQSSRPDYLWPLVGLGLALILGGCLVLRSRASRRRP